MRPLDRRPALAEAVRKVCTLAHTCKWHLSLDAAAAAAAAAAAVHNRLLLLLYYINKDIYTSIIYYYIYIYPLLEKRPSLPEARSTAAAGAATWAAAGK